MNGMRETAGWRRALRLLWGVGPWHVSGVLLCTVATAGVPALNVVLLTVAVQAVADAAGGAPDRLDAALTAGGVLASLLVVSHVFTTVRGYLEVLLRQRLTDSVNVAIMSKAVDLSLADFEDPEVYDRLQRANREATFRPYQIFNDLVSTATQSITLVSLSAVLLSWHVGVALAVILAPVPAMLAQVVYSRVGYRVEHARSADRRRTTYLQLLVTQDRTYKEIRLFGLGEHLVDRYRSLVRDFYRVDRGIEARQSVTSGLLGLVSVAASAGAILFAVIVTVRDGDVGRFAGYVSSIALMQTAVSGLFGGVAQLYEHNLFLANLFAFLDEPRSEVEPGRRPESPTRTATAFPEALQHGVEFRDVWFTYPGADRPVLRGFDLTLPAGQSTALVGANGAGKTTLVKLLAGFYVPTEGQILVDGTPLGDFDPDELRRHLGVIFQDFVQYEATVRENVGYGRLDRIDDSDAVREALQRAGAAPVVERLPGGLDSQLGRWFHDGHQLSGGEWQKIALARAFLRDAPVLVLDEPTASIDAAAEAELFGRITDISRAATTLLIAHRFSTVRAADHIAVLKDGRLQEKGSHGELMRVDGHYAHLFRLQAAGYVDDVGDRPSDGDRVIR